jgi:hypothetical protein
MASEEGTFRDIPGNWAEIYPLVSPGIKIEDEESGVIAGYGATGDIDMNGYTLIGAEVVAPLELVRELVDGYDGLAGGSSWEGDGPNQYYILQQRVAETNSSSLTVPVTLHRLKLQLDSGNSMGGSGPFTEFVTQNNDGTEYPIGKIGFIGDFTLSESPETRHRSGAFQIQPFDEFNGANYRQNVFRVIREGHTLIGVGSTFSRSQTNIIEVDGAGGPPGLQLINTNMYIPTSDKVIKFLWRGGVDGNPLTFNNAAADDVGACAGGGAFIVGKDPFTYTEKARFDVQVGIATASAVKTGDYSMGNDDVHIRADSTSNDVTITLPTPSEGRLAIVQRINGNSGFDVILDSPTGNVNNQATIFLPARWDTAICYSDGTNWIVGVAGGAPNVKAIEKITSNTTLDGTHSTVLVDASGGAVTATLPAASGNTGLTYNIKSIDSTNTVTVDGNGSETIDGSTTVTLATDESITIQCDGTEWWII